jgi:outer membrane protein assembly factor BamB
MPRPSAGLDIEQLWVANPHMVMEGAPMVVDLDRNGDAEIVTAAYENIIAVDGSGKELWRFDTRGRYSTCPAILERNGEPPLIYAGDNTGMFTCLDGMGKVRWQTEVKSIFCASPALADLNANGTIEVIQGDMSGTVSVFDALTGKPVWKASLEGECASPAIGDLDGNGKLEIVIATGAGKVFAIDAFGKVVWRFAVGDTSPNWATSSPILFGNSKGQPCVAVASPLQRFFCLDSKGNLLWERPTRGAAASTISAGDFDADGRADLFVVTQLGALYRFDEEGAVLWDIDTQGRSLASGAIIDLDGDGKLEYVLCTQNGNLLVFNNAGEIVFNHQFDNRTINMTPAFGDIVRKRPGLEFAVTGGESGRVFCFATSAPADTPAQWRTYRGDNRLTAAWFGLSSSDTVRMMPETLNWDDLFTGDDITFRIVNPNPGDAPLTAEASCVRPDGSRQAAVGKSVGMRGLLTMPVSITAPGVYRFEWALKDHSGNKLLAGRRELTLQPYRNDQAMANRAVLALREAIGEGHVAETDNGLKAAMHKESLDIEGQAAALAFLQAAAPGSTPAFRQDLDTRTAALNARAQRALALARVTKPILANAPDTRVVAFEGTMWENRDVDRQLPAEIAIPLRITRRCVVGEHEPVSIKLLNVTLDKVVVGARVRTTPDGPSVTACEVKSVPTNQGTTAWDAITPLGDRTITIPPLETRELWLDTNMAGAKPGVHQVNVAVGSGTSETKVEIVLQAQPFEMAEFGAMRLCCWASYNDHAVKDLLAHGNNVFTAGLPPGTVGEGDTSRITIDFSALDKFVALLAGHDVFLLMSGIPSLGVPMADEAYVPRLANYLDQVMAHLAARGIDEARVALYPYDEPGGNGWETVKHYIAFARQGLKARPGLKFYVNGGGDLPMFEALNDVTAIWCPGFYMLSENTPEMNFLRGSGKRLWSYDCAYAFARPVGANTKTINLVAQYRMAAVFGLNFGATGIGFWCYNVGPSMWDPIRDEYPLVYANSDDTHTLSRRWEAVREGMEDTRILIALRERLSDASVNSAAKAKIHHLLEKTLRDLSRQALDEAHLGAARYVLDASNNDNTVETVRREMLDCVALLVK